MALQKKCPLTFVVRNSVKPNAKQLCWRVIHRLSSSTPSPPQSSRMYITLWARNFRSVIRQTEHKVKSLIEEHRQVSMALFSLCIVLLTFMFTTIIPLINQVSWISTWNAEWFTAFLTSATVYGAIYSGGLFIYDNWVWRMLPHNKKYDCNGIWKFTAKRKSADGLDFVDSYGVAEIVQTAQKISIEGRSSKSSFFCVRCLSYNADANKGYVVYTATKRDAMAADQTIMGCASFNIFGRKTDVYDYSDMPTDANLASQKVKAPGASNKTALRNKFTDDGKPTRLVFHCVESYTLNTTNDFITIEYTRISDKEYMRAQKRARKMMRQSSKSPSQTTGFEQLSQPLKTQSQNDAAATSKASSTPTKQS